MDLIDQDINRSVIIIKEIKSIIKPILNKYGITDINLLVHMQEGKQT